MLFPLRLSHLASSSMRLNGLLFAPPLCFTTKHSRVPAVLVELAFANCCQLGVPKGFSSAWLQYQAAPTNVVMYFRQWNIGIATPSPAR